MRIGRSVVFTQAGRPLEIRSHEVPAPAPHELLVRVTHAGVCGTDAHRLSGDVRTPATPICFGHEGVGVVDALGDEVTGDRAGATLSVGDRVSWSPPTPCGSCSVCAAGGSTALCEALAWPVPYGAATSAGYQDYATIKDTSAFYRLADHTTSESAIAFGCALPTALGGVRRLGDLSGATVVVQGAGPVGLAACLSSSLSGAAHIIIVGDPSSRLTAAARFGADHAIALAGSTGEQRVAEIMDLTDGRGADVVIEAAGHVSAFTEGVSMVAVAGTYLVMGIYSGSATVAFNPVVINNRDLVIRGSLGNGLADFQRAVEVAGEHGRERDFDSLISHRFELAETQSAIECVRRGEASKAVVVPTGVTS